MGWSGRQLSCKTLVRGFCQRAKMEMQKSRHTEQTHDALSSQATNADGCLARCFERKKRRQARISWCTLLRGSPKRFRETVPDSGQAQSMRSPLILGTTNPGRSTRPEMVTFCKALLGFPAIVVKRCWCRASRRPCDSASFYHKPTCPSGTPCKLTRRRGSPTTAGAQTRQPTTRSSVSDRPSTPADPCPLRRAFLFGPGSCRNAGHPVQLSAIPLESKDGGRAERGHRQANGRPKAHHVPRARSPAFWRNLVVSF